MEEKGFASFFKTKKSVKQNCVPVTARSCSLISNR